ncbi:hypothetical protein SAMN04244547_05146, partial [Azotobacter vinelandii]
RVGFIGLACLAMDHLVAVYRLTGCPLRRGKISDHQCIVSCTLSSTCREALAKVRYATTNITPAAPSISPRRERPCWKRISKTPVRSDGSKTTPGTSTFIFHIPGTTVSDTNTSLGIGVSIPSGAMTDGQTNEPLGTRFRHDSEHIAIIDHPGLIAVATWIRLPPISPMAPYRLVISAVIKINARSFAEMDRNDARATHVLSAPGSCRGFPVRSAR